MPFWIGQAPRNEEEAYNIAIKGYRFSRGFGTLSQKELDNIATDPPDVGYHEYLRYRRMTPDQLAEQLEGIVEIIPNPRYEDLFNILTRHKSLNNDQIGDKLKRAKRFKELKEVNQKLLLGIYGSKHGYLTANERDPLEQYILEFDNIMGYNYEVRRLAGILHIGVPYDADPSIYFYTYLENYIAKMTGKKGKFEDDIRAVSTYDEEPAGTFHTEEPPMLLS